MYDVPDDQRSGLSRIAPCSHCGHDEHLLRCLALVDRREDVVCPCRVPIPGVYIPAPRKPST